MKRNALLYLVIIPILFFLAACDSPLTEHALVVEVVGMGTVEPGTGIFEKGTIVTFDIQAADGWAFSRWEGKNKDDVQKKDNGEWSILINGGKEITAVFERLPYELAINVLGEGHVEQEIYSIKTENEEYPYGAIVDLAAVPADGWRFVEWRGDIESTKQFVRIKMDADKEVTVVFERQLVSLNVDVKGRGKVVKEAANREETIFKLEAVPEEGYEFVRWQGDVESTESVIVVELDGLKKITAIFSGPALSGYVVDTDGGPAVAGARVFGNNFEAFTNEEGYFAIEKVDKSREFDLFVEKDGDIRAFVQEIYLDEDEVLEFWVPIRESFHPGWSMRPPRIIVEGVKRGDVVSDYLDVAITVDGELDMLVFYVDFTTFQSFPPTYEFVNVKEGRASINTRNFPNGDGFLRIMAYDKNENLSMRLVPVTIDNQAEKITQLPEDLGALRAHSVTFGESVGLYAEQRREMFERLNLSGDPAIIELENGLTVDLNSIIGDGTLYIDVQWDIADEARGYSVYRSLDGENFKWIGDTEVAGYRDCSPDLTPGERVYYKVLPYNDAGFGNGLVRSVIPLKPFNVVLLEPANRAYDVPLQPTFRWAPSVEFPNGTEITYEFFLFFGALPFSWTEKEVKTNTYRFPEKLEPSAVHSWDITRATAYRLGEKDETGYSESYSFGGNGTGSLDGEYVFTTTANE